MVKITTDMVPIREVRVDHSHTHFWVTIEPLFWNYFTGPFLDMRLTPFKEYDKKKQNYLGKIACILDQLINKLIEIQKIKKYILFDFQWACLWIGPKCRRSSHGNFIFSCHTFQRGSISCPKMGYCYISKIFPRQWLNYIKLNKKNVIFKIFARN